jgi:hypothetical protein
MDPADLPAVVDPVARGAADYVKGTRFRSADVVTTMPTARLLVGLLLSWATAAAIGQAVSDSQCGYTAISRDACARIDLRALWPRYGYPNDLLAKLAAAGIVIGEAPVRAVYGDEKSRLRPRHVITIAGLVARGWLKRLQSQRSR